MNARILTAVALSWVGVALPASAQTDPRENGQTQTQQPEPQPTETPVPTSVTPPPAADMSTPRDDDFAMKIFGGWSRIWLYGLPMDLATFDIAPGGTLSKGDHSVDGFVAFHYARGRSPANLLTQEFVVRPEAQLRVSRFVFGLGARIGYFHMERATSGAIESALLGAETWIGFEPIVFSDHGIFLEARAHADAAWGVDKTKSWHIWLDGIGPWIPGVSLGGGFRW